MANGRCVLVSGAESGIGAACAIAFGALGDKVVALFHDSHNDGSDTVAKVKAAGGDAITVQCDVGDEASVEAAFAAAERAFGLVTVLVNSAGINMAGVPVRQMTLPQWQRMLDTDLDRRVPHLAPLRPRPARERPRHDHPHIVDPRLCGPSRWRGLLRRQGRPHQSDRNARDRGGTQPHSRQRDRAGA